MDYLNGHPLSNILAEVYLDQFDKRISHWPDYGCKIIRYVDDIFLMCKRKSEARAHSEIASNYLNDLGLDNRSCIKHVNEGVKVLGFIIDRRTKRPLPEKVKEHKKELISLLLGPIDLSNSESNETKRNYKTIYKKIKGWKQYYGNQYAKNITKWTNGIINETQIIQ